MKLLSVLPNHHEMRYSLSITGVTILRQNRYKQRHGGSREIIQTPDQGLETAAGYRRRQPPPPVSKRKKKKQPKPETPTITQPKQIRKYRIDKKEVTHRIRGYINQMKGEKLLYFWTVTFPINTTDSTCYLLLNKWFTRLRKEGLLKDYLWIAERQKNSTIHFHIVINNRMDVKKANRYMRASIMHSINAGEINWSRNQAMRYNGVDICKDRKTRRVTNFAKMKSQRSLANYLTKYVTKNDSTFQNLAWHSSRGYSNLITSVRFTYGEILNSKVKHLIDRENPLTGEYYLHYNWKQLPPKDLMTYLALINQHIQLNLLK